MTFRPPRGNVGKKFTLKYSSDPCTYKHYNCTQPCVENYSLCVRHILEDKTAPFKQCNYIYTVTGRRCPLPAPKNERRESYCSEHVRKVQLRQSKHRGTSQPPLTTERLLSSISHYVKAPEDNKIHTPSKFLDEEKIAENTSSAQETASDQSDRDNVLITKCLNPFVDINAVTVNNSLHKVLEYCSESDSDVDVTTIEHTTRYKDEDSSDAESADSAGEDIFKHANVYTPEEITLRTKEKLIRLQTLYIEQFKRLQHVLKERRRDYIHTLQKEKETLCSIANQPKETVKEQKLYDKLKSLNHYHKRYGVEAILHKKALERRTLVTEGIPNKTSSSSKCIFTEGGVKCSVKTLPCAKYCNKHILEDPHQMLFRQCGVNKGVSTCQEPVLHMFPTENCIFHFNLPPAQLTYNTTLSSEDEEEMAIPKTEIMEKQSFAITTSLLNQPKMSSIKEEEKEYKEAVDGDIKIETDLKQEEFYDRFTGEGDLPYDIISVSEHDSKMHKLMQMEELPLQIMEGKEVSPDNRPGNQSDHMYYMNENCLNRQNVHGECTAPFESDESGDLLMQ